MRIKTVDAVVELGRQEQFLAVVSHLRASGTIYSSLLDAGVMVHPLTGARGPAFVTSGEVKLRTLRLRPHAVR